MSNTEVKDKGTSIDTVKVSGEVKVDVKALEDAIQQAIISRDFVKVNDLTKKLEQATSAFTSAKNWYEKAQADLLIELSKRGFTPADFMPVTPVAGKGRRSKKQGWMETIITGRYLDVTCDDGRHVPCIVSGSYIQGGNVGKFINGMDYTSFIHAVKLLPGDRLQAGDWSAPREIASRAQVIDKAQYDVMVKASKA